MSISRSLASPEREALLLSLEPRVRLRGLNDEIIRQHRLTRAEVARLLGIPKSRGKTRRATVAPAPHHHPAAEYEAMGLPPEAAARHAAKSCLCRRQGARPVPPPAPDPFADLISWTASDERELKRATELHEQRCAELDERVAAAAPPPAEPLVIRRVRVSSKGSGPDKSPDQRKRITTVPALDRKLAAEEHQHPLSVDWSAAPEGTRQVYRDLHASARNYLSAGGTVALARFRPGPEVAAQVAWLLEGNCYPLIEQIGKREFLMLADRPSALRDKYPGCPGTVNPLAGYVLGDRLSQVITQVISLKDGKELTARQIATLVNQPEVRRALHLEECRYASVEAVTKARQRAQVRCTREGTRYRLEHRWAMATPARWEVVAGADVQHQGLEELQRELNRMLLADPRELARRLRLKAA